MDLPAVGIQRALATLVTHITKEKPGSTEPGSPDFNLAGSRYKEPAARATPTYLPNPVAAIVFSTYCANSACVWVVGWTVSANM